MIIAALCLMSLVVIILSSTIYALRATAEASSIIYAVLGLGLTYMTVMTITLIKIIC